MNNHSSDEVSELRDRQRKIRDKIRRVLAREGAAERKRQTRRKIIVGALILTRATTEPSFETWLKQFLGKASLAPRDLALFSDLMPPTGHESPADQRPHVTAVGTTGEESKA